LIFKTFKLTGLIRFKLQVWQKKVFSRKKPNPGVYPTTDETER